MTIKNTNIQTMICDNCAKELTWDKNGMYFGGHPTNGWVNVYILHKTSIVPSPFPDEHYHFCSKKCCATKFMEPTK